MNLEVTKHYFLEPVTAGELSQYGDTTCDYLIMDQKEIAKEASWHKTDQGNWQKMCQELPENHEVFLVYEINKLSSVAALN